MTLPKQKLMDLRFDLYLKNAPYDLLNLITSTPTETIENLSLVSNEEKKKLILEFNDTQFKCHKN